jgi:hypothetical protein
MKNSSGTVQRIGTAALLLAMAVSAWGQALSDDARAVATHWLVDNCGLQSSLRNDIRSAASPALEAFFLDAARKGPDSSQIAEIEKAAAQHYELRQQALKRPEGLGLSAQDIEDARKVTREDFIAQEKKDFDLRFRSQAVAGLGITGGTKAKTELQQISKDEKSPLRTSAQQALTELQQRK